jgi:phosphoenolpyruvate carboxylase
VGLLDHLLAANQSGERRRPTARHGKEDGSSNAASAWDCFELPSFLRVGSWIGGDRDGDPFVTAEVLRQALGMQSERALKFYLDGVIVGSGTLLVLAITAMCLATPRSL